MQNRDVYCQDYNKFIYNLATVNTAYEERSVMGDGDQNTDLSVPSVKLKEEEVEKQLIISS